MATEPNEVRQVNWTEVFSFTQIFKSRKLATHPSKLILAFLFILFVFGGGKLMDLIWSTGGSYVNTSGNEIYKFAVSNPSYDRMLEGWKDSRRDAAEELYKDLAPQTVKPDFLIGKLSGEVRSEYRSALSDIDAKEVKAEIEEDDSWSELLGEACDAFGAAKGEAKDLLDTAYDKARTKAKDDSENEEERDKALEEVDNQYLAGKQGLAQLENDFDKAVRSIRGETVATSFLRFEMVCVRNALRSVIHGRLFGGLNEFTQPSPGAKDSVDTGIAFPAPEDKRGVLFYLVLAVHGVRWLFAEHLIYALIFSAYIMAGWALFGGAIYRIAALHAAREEKASIGQALRFAASKFFSFFAAPLIPLAVILLVGGLLMLGGLLGNAFGAGALILGILFFLSLIGGVVIAFLLFGLLGGCGLMYPTIAVEGSDSFDAISRSYSYIFNRPWRAGLYALVALFHGTLCYVFVRLFAFAALKATHMGVKFGIWAGGDTIEGAHDKLDVMWPAPTFQVLHAPLNSAALSTFETLGAWFMALWVYIIVGMVGAFLISYFVSASTEIYYLLRRHVDATDLDDVFVEEAEEEDLLPLEADAAPAEGDEEGDDA